MKSFCGNELAVGTKVVWAKTRRSGCSLTHGVVVGLTDKSLKIEVTDWRGKRTATVGPDKVTVPAEVAA